MFLAWLKQKRGSQISAKWNPVLSAAQADLYFLGWHKEEKRSPATHFVTQVLRRTKQIKATGLPQGPAIHTVGQGSFLCCQHPPSGATRGPQLLLHAEECFWAAGRGGGRLTFSLPGQPGRGCSRHPETPLPAFLGTAELWRLYLSA